MKRIPDEVAQFFAYDPDTGIVTWKRQSPNHRRSAGDVAGVIEKNTGYMRLSLRGVNYQAHRVAWFLMTGTQPDEIDHRDRDPGNNRWLNLRDGTHELNCGNRVSGKGSLAKGVRAKRGRFEASITARGKRHYLGSFATEPEAAAAYRSAATAHFGEYAHA